MEKLSLRETQLVALDICNTVNKICNEQGLRYYLYGGSLLGAIRHKGFIPWDDDIDIVMPREDYKKLLQYFDDHEQELRPLKMFSNYNCSEYPYMISRVSNDEYFIDMENEKSYGMGVFIDVYPWDGIGNTEQEVLGRKRKASRLSSLCYLSTRKRCIKENTKSKIRLLIKPIAFAIAKIFGKKYFMNRLEKMAEKLEKQCSYDNAYYVGCLVWGSGGARGIVPREWLEPYVQVEFEGNLFRAPKEYDRILTKIYNNYMKLPPKEAQIPHHYYSVYRKTIGNIQESYVNA